LPPRKVRAPVVPSTEVRVRRSRGARPEVDGDTLPTVSIDVGVTGAPSQEWLREIAGYIYTTSLQKITLAELSDHPSLGRHVPARTLESWSRKYGWVEERQRNATAWREAMVRETGRELVEFRRDQLKKLRVLGEIMFKELLPDKEGKIRLSINSYESMAQAFVKVVAAGDQLTEAALSAIMPDVQPTVEGASAKSEVALKSDMTIEEARIGAKAILQARREQQRRLLAAPGESSTPKGV